jgi:hypothetical protein
MKIFRCIHNLLSADRIAPLRTGLLRLRRS